VRRPYARQEWDTRDPAVLEVSVVEAGLLEVSLDLVGS
jgi:hypothetical protein